MVKFNSVRGNKLVAGLFVAQLWMTKNRRVAKLVRVREVVGGKINEGVTVVCDELTATTHDKVLQTMVDGKMVRVTFGTLVDQELALPAPSTQEAAFDAAMETVEQHIEAKAKRVRKPLTAEQKARKNELARARRAAAKVAA